MKKLLYLFSAFLLVLTSCSKDDDNSSDSTSFILPKTLKESYPSNPSNSYTSTIVYDGNRILSVKSSNNLRKDYAYDGNVIVKITTYNSQSGTDVKSHEDLFTYANNKLATHTYAANFTSQYPNGQYRGKFVYTYNSDGTVKKEMYSIGATTGAETKENDVTVLTFANGNLVKEVTTDTASNDVYTGVYEYDSKNNPYKNVLGYNLLLDVDYNNRFSSVNNIVKATYTDSGSSSAEIFKTTYEYDANGYPIKETNYNSGGTTVSYIDEYTY